MKTEIESRPAKGLPDFIALAITTWGVGYLPVAPGTFGSIVGVIIYLAVSWVEAGYAISLSVRGWRFEEITATIYAVNAVLLLLLTLAGIWASGRSTELLGNSDPSAAVVDEVIGQLIVFLFVPFAIPPFIILAGFLLFRLFDIWKPYPIDDLQVLRGGIGICGDDILAGVYGGV